MKLSSVRRKTSDAHSPNMLEHFSCLQAPVVITVVLLSSFKCQNDLSFHFKEQQNSKQVFSCCLQMTSCLSAYGIYDGLAAKIMS